MGLRDRVVTVFHYLLDQPEAKTIVQAAQFGSTLLFVVLYIWSTYSPPPLWSLRYNLDLFLCAMFAVDYISRFLVCHHHHAMVQGACNLPNFVKLIMSELPAKMYQSALQTSCFWDIAVTCNGKQTAQI